jgi:DNA-binding transcriptional regulator YdaS (Cro superfamily)
MNPRTKKTALRALKAAIALEGPTALARKLNVKPPTLYVWLKTGRAPAERVLEIEAATQISRHELRADIYPLAPDSSPNP